MSGFVKRQRYHCTGAVVWCCVTCVHSLRILDVLHNINLTTADSLRTWDYIAGCTSRGHWLSHRRTGARRRRRFISVPDSLMFAINTTIFECCSVLHSVTTPINRRRRRPPFVQQYKYRKSPVTYWVWCFTALHCMHRGIGDRKAVRPPVRQAHELWRNESI